MQSYYSSILQRPVSEQKDRIHISKKVDVKDSKTMLSGEEVEEIDINREEKLPLNQSYKDPESLDHQITDNDVEAIDFHMNVRNNGINMSMFNLATFFHPRRDDESLINEFRSMGIGMEEHIERYEDIEGQISTEEHTTNHEEQQESRRPSSPTNVDMPVISIV